MVGMKGYHDDCAAAIIILFNLTALAISIAGLAGLGYIAYLQTNPGSNGAASLNIFTPVAVLVVGIFICSFVLIIAMLGIVTTCAELKANKLAEQRKENAARGIPEPPIKDKNGNIIPSKAPKRCCHNAGLLVYIAMSLFAFLFMFLVGVIAGVYSGKLDHVNYVAEARETGDAWVYILENQVSGLVVEMDKQDSELWSDTQALMGCCGWNITAAGAAAAAAGTTTMSLGGRRLDDKTTTATTTSTAQLAKNHADVFVYSKDCKCCQYEHVKTAYSADEVPVYDTTKNCWVDDGNAVYTCQGLVAQHMKGNMLAICACAVVFSIVQLALAIAGCVVRFPVLCKCCDWSKKNKAGQAVVAPAP